jgi:hypothetical protein
VQWQLAKTLSLTDRQLRPGYMLMVRAHLFGQIETILTCGNPREQRLVHDVGNNLPSNLRASKGCATLRTIAVKDT